MIQTSRIKVYEKFLEGSQFQNQGSLQIFKILIWKCYLNFKKNPDLSHIMNFISSYRNLKKSAQLSGDYHFKGWYAEEKFIFEQASLMSSIFGQ
jgi:hypothetical protein